MSDRFLLNLLKWSGVALFVIFAGGKLAILIQNPPLDQRMYEDMVLATTVAVLALTIGLVAIVLFVVETVRRVRREK